MYLHVEGSQGAVSLSTVWLLIVQTEDLRTQTRNGQNMTRNMEGWWEMQGFHRIPQTATDGGSCPVVQGLRA